MKEKKGLANKREVLSKNTINFLFFREQYKFSLGIQIHYGDVVSNHVIR